MQRGCTVVPCRQYLLFVYVILSCTHLALCWFKHERCEMDTRLVYMNMIHNQYYTITNGCNSKCPSVQNRLPKVKPHANLYKILIQNIDPQNDFVDCLFSTKKKEKAFRKEWEYVGHCVYVCVSCVDIIVPLIAVHWRTF